MKTAYILYENYLSRDGSRISVGGIQTYINNLIPIIQNLGYKVHIYQHSERNFEVEKDNVTISGISEGQKKEEIILAFKRRILKEIRKESDLLIFGCETFAFESKEYKSIAIQHGISWDVPFSKANTRFKYLVYYVRKSKRAWDTIRRVSSVRHLVCVDYNFVNWYRALTAFPLVKLNVIPNFTQIPVPKPVKPQNRINVIFARRLFDYRGTRIFTEAIKPLLKKYTNLYVTIAGEGPDEHFLKKKLGDFDRVEFTKYTCDQSLAMHADKHIALVPTLGSEGTSLSLLEAMASGCAVVCTNVGGMTNIVLDHYNGLMISPNSSDLHDAIENLIDDANLREYVSLNAYETASQSFSISKWQRSWERVLRQAEE